MKPKYLLFSLLLGLSLLMQAWADPLVVAHRGGTELGPENRLETFRRAIELEVDAIELDIHKSVDGVLFVIHDSTLTRTFGVEGKVNEMTAEELARIGVPTLSEVFSLVEDRVKLIVEIKASEPGIEEALAALLEEYGLLDSAIVISFHSEPLRELHRLCPSLATGFLYGSTESTPEQLKAELGIRYLGPHYSQVNSTLIRQVRQAGLLINPWTVDDEESLRKMIELGCDAVTTNYPTRLLKLLKKSPSSHHGPRASVRSLKHAPAE